MNKVTKFLFCIITTFMFLNMGAFSVFAEEYPLLLSVTLPTSLDVYVDANGKCTTSDVQVVNHSVEGIAISSIKVCPEGDWKLANWTDEELNVDQKTIGMTINGVPVDANGNYDTSNIKTMDGNSKLGEINNTINLDYEV